MNTVNHSDCMSVLTMLTMIGLNTAALAQQDSTKQFDRIFGSAPNYNGTVLISNDGATLKHDTTTCSLSYIELNGQVRWTKDLKPYGCRLLYLNNPEEREADRYDVLIQFENKESFQLRSKTGQMKPMVIDQRPKTAFP